VSGFIARMLGRDPASRRARAERLLSEERFADARWAIEGLDGPEATALRERAQDGLVELNLVEARARFSSSDVAGGREHLELARQFGATTEQLRAVRRMARELRETAEREAAAAQADPVEPEGDDPLWSLPPEDPRIRYALKLEGWPDDLRLRLAALGPEFAALVLSIDDGGAAAAHEALASYSEREPAVYFEQARAAMLLGQVAVMVRDLEAFAEALGHRRVAGVHTAIQLARGLVSLRRASEGLAMLDTELKRSDDLDLAAARLTLLEAIGEHAQAEKGAVGLLGRASRDMGLYHLLGRVRLAQGNRLGATQALEGGLTTCCSSPGKCGNQPFDASAGRLLARLYLEDRIEPKRTQELLRELERSVRAPGWEDLYLAALVARNREAPDALRMARSLWSEAPAGDPRRARVAQAFGF